MEKFIILSKEMTNEYVDESNNKMYVLPLDTRINLITGENNSGKSRFMRNLILTRSNVFKQLRPGYEASFNYDIILNKRAFESIKEQDKAVGKIIEKALKEINESKDKNLLLKLEDILEKTVDSQLAEKDTLNDAKKVLYIPLLRGIEGFSRYFENNSTISTIKMTAVESNALTKYMNQTNEVYLNKISGDYKIDKNIVFTAETLYQDIINILLGGEEKRKQFHEFEKFMSDNFYEGKNFEITPDISKKILLVKIADDKEYEIYNLGDGIKQLISILYPIYIHKDENYYFFIEEPEINIHPGLQRKLMDILLSDTFKKHKYFITTHSNSIIDIINYSDNVSLYKIKKDENNFKISKTEKDFVSVLNELGVSTSSVFLSNCTIWVEGISDRIYLKKYLELYFKKYNINKYKENIHYCFIEYGGGNIPHFNFENIANDSQIFINAISHNAFLLVDNDNTKEKPESKKEQRKERYRKILKENFFELKSREIENLISLNILEKYLISKNNLKSLTRKKYLGANEYRYTQDTISNPRTYMGKFIDETYNIPNKSYSANSGTIAKKYEFAIGICSVIEDYDELSDQAKELTEKVYEFIKKNNNIL